MHYRVAVEDIEPDHWVAWVFELPGCFASARTESEAVAAAPASIARYFNWSARHGRRLPGAQHSIETDLVAVFHARTSEGDYVVNAFLETDRLPLTTPEVEQALWLLDCSRQDLLTELDGAPSARLSQPLTDEVRGSLQDILRHIAQAERFYFQNVGLEQSALPEDPRQALDQARAQTRTWLPELVGDQRVTEWKGERWSVRKVLRRILWHERDHTQQISSLLGR